MNNAWDLFFREKILKIFTENKKIIDIGGGLRLLKNRGNRYEPKNSWLIPYLDKVDYKIMDPVPDYNPDIIGDIHHMPFADNSQEAVLCFAILEHVEDPFLACREIYRVLKTGGQCLIYVPFLYYFHAEKGYYSDYWRFTKDAFPLLFKNFSSLEIQGVRGALSTWLHLSPLGHYKIINNLADFLDKIFKKDKSNQVSGYFVFLVK